MKYLLAVIALAAVLHSPLSGADANDAEVMAIRAQLLELSRRLDKLEQSNVALTQVNAPLKEANGQTAYWAEKIKIKGDFRYRVENTDETGKPERNRQRIRARATIIAKPQDGLEIGLGFASGSDDPVSTNQTLGGGGSSKGLNLDLAYFSWTGMENIKIIAGKFKNILHKSGGNELLWDGDWNPEGFAVQWENGSWFGNVIGTWIESDSKARTTEFSYVLQGGFLTEFASGASLKSGLTYTDFGTAGKGSFFGGDDEFFGNSFDPQTNTYLHDYKELEVFAGLSFVFLDRPALLFADYVQNQDAGVFDTAYAFGLTLGAAKNTGDWSLGWVYQDIEADAVLGLVTDSDFAGGGTDSKGHIFKGAYGLNKYINASISYYINEIDGNLGTPRDLDKLQLNINFKY